MPADAPDACEPLCAAAGALTCVHASSGAAALPAPSHAVAARQQAGPFSPLSPPLGEDACPRYHPKPVRPWLGSTGPMPNRM